MDGMGLTLYLLATLAGGLTSGLAGFAMGIVLSGMWLHIISPAQTATLIVGYGLLTQGYAVWKLRHALRWQNVAPFVITGAIGAPIGATLLAHVDPTYLRTGFSVLLVLYSIYGLAQPAFKLVPRTRSSHHNCRESDCELRVQSGTRIIKMASVLRFRSSLRSVRQTRANFGIGTLKRLPPDLNRRDSHEARDERVFWH
jgi:uncharacterized membrane protein YfcA